jgi:cytochrome c biogenesis protein CcmG, thiol:disulfide interchange protein DsbE
MSTPRVTLPPPEPRSAHLMKGNWWRHITPWNVIVVLLTIWAAPRLLPHLGALVGVRSGGSVVPAWTANSLDGQRIGSDSLRGRVVLVNVWATWCLPCRAEMPLLQRMHERHRDAGFSLIGLSVDRGPVSEVEAFLRDRGITYPVAIIGDDVVNAFGGVRGYPTSFLVDRRGTIRHAVIGPLAPASLELAVRRLLQEREPPPTH